MFKKIKKKQGKRDMCNCNRQNASAAATFPAVLLKQKQQIQQQKISQQQKQAQAQQKQKQAQQKLQQKQRIVQQRRLPAPSRPRPRPPSVLVTRNASKTKTPTVRRPVVAPAKRQ
jgi:hypothetical protein